MAAAETPVIDRPGLGFPTGAGRRAPQLERARGRFLRTGEIPASVRPEIGASWRRSVLSGYDRNGGGPRHCPDLKLDSHFARSARSVLSSREPMLRGTGCAFVLTDASVRILYRSEADPRLAERLDAERVLPRYCFAEEIVGTNAAAMAVETGLAAEVHGAEHLSLREATLSCAAVPIEHPANRRLLGTLGLVCHSDQVNALILPWLHEVAERITRRLGEAGSAEERRIFEAYLESKRGADSPLVCVGERTVVGNSAATRMLGPDDQALLWEHANLTIRSEATIIARLPLSAGGELEASCEPIYDGSAAVGARIELRPSTPPEACRDSDGDSADDAHLPGLAGSGPRWRRMCGEVLEAKGREGGLLLTGGPGSGKLAVARALHQEAPVEVVDAALSEVGGTDQWITRLDQLLRQSSGAVVLRHLDALDDATAATVSSLLEALGTEGPEIVGTLTLRDGLRTRNDAPCAWFGSAVEVPSLRERPEDLHTLIDELTLRWSTADNVWRWMPDAIQTLMRVEWPQNVQTLARVVEEVVSGRSPGYVDAHALPAWVQAAGARRPLSRLEQLEAGAITSALSESGGNKLEAAKLLGIARSTLYRRMRSLGISLAGANF